MAEKELTYKEISKKQRKEETKEDLTEIEENFYNELSKYIRNKVKRYKEKKEKNQGKMGDKIVKKIGKEIKNIRKMVRNIYDKREGKIVLRALSDARRESKVDDTSSMLPHEENLYFQTKEVLEKYRKNLLKLVLFGEYGQNQKQGNNKLLKFEQDVPKFIWKNNKKYGPFKKKGVANLPKKLANFLIDKGKAKEVEKK